METSTPMTSPMRKKHSLVQKFIPVDETLGDIESELQTRRQEAINKSTETRKRLSVAPLLAGYTASQLAQHCKDVIKLSTENKINVKNAFNFWLIDVMAAMAKKTDSEINKNFQVASCTLDASVKIYGFRVDAIHTDAIKMAGGFFSKEVALEAGEEKENNEGVGEENPVKTKLKKKRKKLTVVAPETLNAKSEAEVLMDVVPQQNFLSRKTTGNDLLVKIPKYNDGGLLLLDSDYPCWPYDDNASIVPKFENKEIFDHTDLLSLLGDVKISKDDVMSSTYCNFVFGKQCKDNSDSEDEFQTSQNSCPFEFDVNASVGDVSMDDDCEPDNQRDRINIPAGGFDSDEEIHIQPEKPQKTQSLAISDMKSRISLNPLEYSMFDEKVFKAWAGPAHWKVRPVRKPLEENGNNEDVSKPVASKRTRKGRIKASAGLFDMFEDVLVKNLAESEKTTLFKSTMLNWNPANTTVPEDRKCKAKNLFCLYHIPSLVMCLKPEEKKEELNDISDHHDEEDEENEEELEYCSTSLLHDNSHQMDEEHNVAGQDEAWDSGNMVEAPNKVEKIQVSAFKRRKHVDIKHLKKGLWNILTKDEAAENKEATVKEPIEFSELVKSYPTKVPQNFGSSLSAPLIFNALLHLTNEKGLDLTQDKSNIQNFMISQKPSTSKTDSNEPEL